MRYIMHMDSVKNKYYDGAKLLSLKDLDGLQPEIYICVSNRTAGKTTYFARFFVNAFLKRDEKFILLYRYDYEVSDIATKFFGDIRTLFFPGYTMISKARARGAYHEIMLVKNGSEEMKTCGYALALNKADQIKKYSHVFNDVQRIMFDEFQSENDNYAANEIKKFQSVHTSIARGQGKQTRYVPVYMLSNTVSIINPYYTKFGISDRLRSNTRYMRGRGWVFEQSYNEAAAAAMAGSGFARAFAGDDYQAYATQNVYLNDSTAFIEKPAGKSRYLGTIRYNGADYALREYAAAGVVYCDDKPDMSYPYKIAVTTEDHNINYVMLKTNEMFISGMRYYFNNGAFRFKNLLCKEALLKLIAYY